MGQRSDDRVLFFREEGFPLAEDLSGAELQEVLLGVVFPWTGLNACLRAIAPAGEWAMYFCGHEGVTMLRVSTQCFEKIRALATEIAPFVECNLSEWERIVRS